MSSKGGPDINENGLVLFLDAANRLSYDGNIIVYSVQCYSTYSGLRSSNYTVQYSDDNSNWTTAFTGVMSNNSSCGIITGTGVNTSNLTAHKYWRYVEGSAIASHHPRVSRIDFITPNGSVYNLITYTSDNCADSGTYVVGTVSKQFTPSNWRDLSGNSNTGTLTNGPTFSAGNLGSILFDGTDDYTITTLNATPLLNISSQLTIDVWIKSTTLANASHGDGIISKGTSSDNNSSIYELLLASDLTKNYPFFRIYTSTAYSHNPSNIPIELNNIYNVVCTYDGANMKIYINGQISGTQSSASGTLQSNTQQLCIGVRHPLLFNVNSFDSWFNGNVYSTKIYNRALSATEALQNFQATRTRFGV